MKKSNGWQLQNLILGNIYVDNVLKFSKTGYSKITGKIDFNVNVKNGQTLKIAVGIAIIILAVLPLKNKVFKYISFGMIFVISSKIELSCGFEITLFTNIT